MTATVMDPHTVDALSWARANPERFFRGGRADSISLLAYLMADVLELGSGSCTILRVGSWWIIGSDRDWLQHPRYSASELFAHVVPAPEHGEHSMRGEVTDQRRRDDSRHVSWQARGGACGLSVARA
ncbi:MAG: hypothetical protein F9K40_01390 [Kofleriaceae bacterium]|nr:MAG: hypothetical protein F9K40_01390 [Kofleriaceae bacterium]MBZ0236493.1 hypothetical protein [Kofleriaceae bacterium]